MSDYLIVKVRGEAAILEHLQRYVSAGDLTAAAARRAAAAYASSPDVRCCGVRFAERIVGFWSETLVEPPLAARRTLVVHHIVGHTTAGTRAVLREVTRRAAALGALIKAIDVPARLAAKIIKHCRIVRQTVCLEFEAPERGL